MKFYSAQSKLFMTALLTLASLGTGAVGRNLEDLSPDERTKLSNLVKHYRNIRGDRFFEDSTSLSPRKLSKTNLLRIKNALRRGDGLSEHEKSLKHPDKLYTDPECLLRAAFDRIPLFLKHATSAYAQIMLGGGQLMSVKERQRQGISVDNSHTGGVGLDDYVYFTLGSREHGGAQFLQGIDRLTTFAIPLAFYQDARGRLTGQLQGLSFGEHLHHFSRNDTFAYRLGDSRRFVQYTRGDEGDGTFSGRKLYRYERADGSVLSRKVKAGDELFFGADIADFVKDNAILELRYIGERFREEILSNLTDQKQLEGFLDFLYHSAHFEARKPSNFVLEEGRFDLTHSKAEEPTTESQRDKANAIRAFELLRAGQADQVMDFIRQEQIAPETLSSLEMDSNDLMSAAIVEKNPGLAAALLDYGVSPVNALLEGRALGLAISRCYVDLVRKILAHETPLKGLTDAALYPLASARGMFSDPLLDALRCSGEMGELLLERWHLSVPEDASSAMYITAALHHGHRELALRMIRGGFGLDALSGGSLLSDVPQPTNPLFWAIEHGDEELFALLLEQGADPNARLWHVYRKVEWYSGYTPLMMAVFHDRPAMAQRLVELGAELTAESLKGSSVCDIARAHDRLASMPFLSFCPDEAIDATTAPVAWFDSENWLFVTSGTGPDKKLLVTKAQNSSSWTPYLEAQVRQAPLAAELQAAFLETATQKLGLPVSKQLAAHAASYRVILQHDFLDEPVYRDELTEYSHFAQADVSPDGQGDNFGHHLTQHTSAEIKLAHLGIGKLRPHHAIAEWRWVGRDELLASGLAAQWDQASRWTSLQLLQPDSSPSFELETRLAVLHDNRLNGPLRLINAIKSYDFATITRLVEQEGAEVNGTLQNAGATRTPLNIAVMQIYRADSDEQIAHARAIVSYLLRRGADPDQPSAPRYSPVAIAIKHGDLGLLQELEAHGATMDLPNSSYFQPLYVALKSRNPAMIDYLLAKPLRPETYKNLLVNQAKVFAKYELEPLKVLLQRLMKHFAIDINEPQPSMEIWSPLVAALIFSSPTHLQALLELGADPQPKPGDLANDLLHWLKRCSPKQAEGVRPIVTGALTGTFSAS